MSVERDHEDLSRICHISHARSETTEWPGAHFAVGDKIGSTALVAMIRCVEPAWFCHGTSHTDLSTRFSQSEVSRRQIASCWVCPHEAADLLVDVVGPTPGGLQGQSKKVDRIG